MVSGHIVPRMHVWQQDVAMPLRIRLYVAAAYDHSMLKSIGVSKMRDAATKTIILCIRVHACLDSLEHTLVLVTTLSHTLGSVI